MPDRTNTDPVNERQRIAVAALADLLTRDLPPMLWHVRPSMVLEHLYAQPSTYGDDDTRLGAMHAWSAALGAAMTSVDRGDHVDHTITARHMGVVIEIFLHTSVTYRYECTTREDAS